MLLERSGELGKGRRAPDHCKRVHIYEGLIAVSSYMPRRSSRCHDVISYTSIIAIEQAVKVSMRVARKPRK